MLTSTTWDDHPPVYLHVGLEVYLDASSKTANPKTLKSKHAETPKP